MGDVTAEPRVWVVRGGNYNELASQVKVKRAVAIGWSSVSDVSNMNTRDELKAAMEGSEPGSGTPGSVGQVFRFANEIEPGDYILTPEKVTAEIHISRLAKSLLPLRRLYVPEKPTT